MGRLFYEKIKVLLLLKIAINFHAFFRQIDL